MNADTTRTGTTRPGEGRGLGHRQVRTPAERNKALLTLMGGLVVVVVVMLGVRQLGGGTETADVRVVASGLGPVQALEVCDDGRVFVDAEALTGALLTTADGTTLRPDPSAIASDPACPPASVALDPFVADGPDGGRFSVADGVISRRDADGTIVVAAGAPVPVEGITGIAVDPAGHVFVSLPDGLRELTPAGTLREIEASGVVAPGPIVAPSLGVIIVGTAAGTLVRVQLPR